MADATTNPAGSPQVSTEDLWTELRKTNDEDIRHEIVRRHQPLVRFLAEHMARKLPRSVDVDDLAQEGSFGLMDAINKFDPERGIKFKTTRHIAGFLGDITYDGIEPFNHITHILV
ncbi:MAG TPA: hypothetical protein EYN86_06465, partial [Planctomycetes bacterium]|nr:hypothetical protein [Planctomycetota bacterium]